MAEYSTHDPQIPRCPDNAGFALVYDPDGNGDRTLPYCRRHLAMMTTYLKRSKSFYTIDTIAPGSVCTAYDDPWEKKRETKHA